MPDYEHIGVTAEFAGMDEFARRIEQYKKTLREAEAATEKAASAVSSATEKQLRSSDTSEQAYAKSGVAVNEYANAVFKGVHRASDAVEEGTASQIKNLRNMRWEIITVLFYFRLFGMAAKAAWKAAGAAYDSHAQQVAARTLSAAYKQDLEGITDALKGVTDGTLGTAAAVSAALTGLIATQGQFTEQYGALWEAAEVVAVVTGEEIVDVFEGLAEAIVEGDAKAAESVATFYDLEGAMEAYAAAQGKAVDEISLAERQTVLLNEVLHNTDVMLANGADEAIIYARSIQQLSGEWETFTAVLFASVGGLEAVAAASDFFSSRLRTLNQIIGLVSAKWAGFIAFATNTAQQLSGLLPTSIGDLFGGNIPDIFETLKAFDLEAAQQAGIEAFEERFRSVAEALGYLDVKTVESEQSLQQWGETAQDVITETDLKSAIDHMLGYEDLMQRHLDKVTDIEEDLQAARLKAMRTYDDKLMDIERDYERRRTDRISDYASRVRLLYERRQQDEVQALDKHLLRLAQLREKYELDLIQSEREYQYRRDMLVAKGDVLAIEDLDARYGLQQQAGKEDYDLRAKQIQDSYELQNQIQKDNLDEQLAYLRAQLEEQLKDIEEQLQQRTEAAQEAYWEDLRQAIARRNEQALAEEQDFARRQLAWANHWAKLARESELGTATVFKIMQSYFGEGATLDMMMAAFMERRAYETDLIAQMLEAVSVAATASIANATIAMTATQKLLGFDYLSRVPTGQGAPPGLGGATGYGGQYAAPGAPPGQSTFGAPQQYDPAATLSWSGKPIPISVTDPMTGRTSTIDVTNELLQALLSSLAVELRRAR